jgi:hypothetical protein
MRVEPRGATSGARPVPSSAPALDPNRLAQATDTELAELFRKVTTLPLEGLINTGRHHIDRAGRTIFNDEHWKGWLPRGLALRDIFSRLATGYAKRFWKQGSRYLGETLYVEGRIRVKHSLEEITLDRPTNDLDPGKYILLRYTDPVFEHLFYDVMRAADDGVIVYGGYTGRFPEGKRGFTSVLMRRYGFAQLGLRDHAALSRRGTKPVPDSLAGEWSMSVITTSDHPTPIGTVSFTQDDRGKVSVACEPDAKPAVLVPSFVVEHYTAADASKVIREMRRVDDQTIVGTWSAVIPDLYRRFIASTPGLFHRDRNKGAGAYTLPYMLTKT